MSNGGLTICAMTQKGYDCLDALCQSGLAENIDLVVGAKDKAVQNDFYEDIAQLCAQNNISFKDRSEVESYSTEYIIAISWRWIIPTDNNQLIVFHDSILPKYRGFAPLVNALINGENEIGVSVLLGNAEFDRGDIILQLKQEVSYPIKIAKAIDQIGALYKEAVVKIVSQIKDGKQFELTPQDESQASYSLWRDEEDYAIDWNQSADRIKKIIDALGNPYQGAQANLNDEIIIIHDASEVEDVQIENRDVGKVLFLQDERPVVVCKTGLLKIESAVFKSNGESIFPLSKYRSRFK